MSSISTNIHFGVKYLRNNYFPSNKKILIVTSQSFEKNKILKELTEVLISNENSVKKCFKESNIKEPNSDYINKLKGQIEGDFDLIIGVGGGSVMDITKFLSFLLVSNNKCEDYDLNKNQIMDSIPLILIPTTCGSGSEVTQYAVATNSITKRKFTVASEYIRPQKCFIFPEFLYSLSYKSIIDSSIDAFIHSFEAFMNHSNVDLLFKTISLDGMRIISEVLQNYSETKILTKEMTVELASASLYGGMSISNYRTGMVHTISVALSEYSDQPHGFLNGKIFNEVLSFNKKAYGNKLILAANKVFNKNVDNISDAHNLFSNFISSFFKNEKIAFITKLDMNHLIDRINQDSGLPDVNPLKFNNSNLKTIINKII